jgi:hypothetical protein
METTTKHLLDSLIKAMTDDIEVIVGQIVSSRKEEPKAVLHLEVLQKKYIESREFTVHILNDMYGV